MNDYITIKEHQEIVAKKEERIEELERRLKLYEEAMKQSKRKQYGSSSEKFVPDTQLGLFDEVENAANPTEPEPTKEEVTGPKKVKRSGKHARVLSALPVEETFEHKLSQTEQKCPECGNEMHEMSYSSRSELVVIPATYKLIEHRTFNYSCRHCEKNETQTHIVTAPSPNPVIKGSIASPSTIAHIIAQKYVMHAPLYRQEQELKKQNIQLSRQTMANWVMKSADDWLRVIYWRMRDKLLEQEVLHADETTVQVLEEEGKKPSSKSFMWLYRTSGDTKKQIVLFEYQPTRSQIHPQKFLSDFRGYLHADGYQGYHKLSPNITIIGCWAHMRRKWVDAQTVSGGDERQSAVVEEALRRIGHLFQLEKEWEKLTADERHCMRQEKGKPLADSYFEWCAKLNFLPKSAAGKAIHYAYSQRRYLMNVYLDGRTEFSNNRAENSIRPFAIGRKNWLFCASIRGAEARFFLCVFYFTLFQKLHLTLTNMTEGDFI